MAIKRIERLAVKLRINIAGVGDSVRCYFCGGGLRNWERGDAPMEEHARWYPKCPHTLLVKGQTYIEKLSQQGDKPEVDGNTSSGHNDSSTATDIINSAAAQNCIQMGYKDNMVQKAIDIYTKTYGKKGFKSLPYLLIYFQSISIKSSTYDIKFCESTLKA